MLGITSSYDEVLHFKSSAAHAVAKSKEKLRIHTGAAGLVQVVADNFDAGISSQNGTKATRALAILLTQSQQPDKERNTSLKETKSDASQRQKCLKICCKMYQFMSM